MPRIAIVVKNISNHLGDHKYSEISTTMLLFTFSPARKFKEINIVMANGMDECSFCSALCDADELIEVKDSLVKLKSGFKEFSDVISNVYMSKVILMTKRLSS